MCSDNIYRFRITIEDLPQPDFFVHICVQHNTRPSYNDLLRKIQQYSQTSLEDIQDYYTMIEKEDATSYKYTFQDDKSLGNAFKLISYRDELTIKLIRKRRQANSNVPLIKPIFVRRPSQITDNNNNAEMDEYYASRKDSGISLDQEIDQFKKHISNKLPAISHIITMSPPNSSFTEAKNNYYLPSPPQTSSYYGSKPTIKLPGLQSIITNSYDPNKQRELAPIHPFLCEPLYVSPPSTASVSPSPHKNNKASHKKTRKHSSRPSQFLCEHVIDKTKGTKCCQSFRRSYDLSRHQTIHLKNRPLCYCQDCGKKFTRLDALRRHERIQGHNKIKNF